MLRAAVRNRLMAAVDGSKRMRSEDFDLTESAKSGDVTATIHYRYEPKYQFKAAFPQKVSVLEGRKVSLLICPGVYSETERLSLETDYQLERSITDWADRIDEELTAIPLVRTMKEQQAEIEAVIGKLADLPDEYFTRDEAAELREKLDALETRLNEGLQGMIEDQADLKEKTEDLHKEIAALKGMIDVLRKPGWAQSLVVRMTSWVRRGDYQKLLKGGVAEMSKQLLIEAGKKSVGM